jgi:hypothetical protein
MWMGELDTLEREYDAYKVKREQIQSVGGKMKVKVNKANKKGV